MLCLRCVKQVFSADSWAKLLGPETDTEFVGESSDACYDGEHVYTEVDLGGRLKPRKRSPILRFIIPVKDLLDSARSFCGFCRIVTGLDTEKRLATGRYERAQVDLQLFEPAWVNGGVLLWFLVQVTLTLDRAKEPTWENKTLLAMTPEKGKHLLRRRGSETLTFSSWFSSRHAAGTRSCYFNREPATAQ